MTRVWLTLWIAVLCSFATLSTGGGGGGGDKHEARLQYSLEESAPLTAHAKIVYIGTLDGSLHAFDLMSGKALWALNGGPILTGHQPNSTTSVMFVADPRDGGMFVGTSSAGGGGELKKLQKNIAQLVNDAPFDTEDGHLYLGQKKSHVYAVDAITGEFKNKYLPFDEIDPLFDDVGNLDENTVLVGRTEYTLTIRDKETRNILWNITMAEYSRPPSSKEDALAHEIAENYRTFTYGDAPNVMSIADAHTGQVLWTKSFSHPTVASYASSQGSFLQKLILHQYENGYLHLEDKDLDQLIATANANTALVPRGFKKPFRADWSDHVKVQTTEDGLSYALVTNAHTFSPGTALIPQSDNNHMFGADDDDDDYDGIDNYNDDDLYDVYGDDDDEPTAIAIATPWSKCLASPDFPNCLPGVDPAPKIPWPLRVLPYVVSLLLIVITGLIWKLWSVLQTKELYQSSSSKIIPAELPELISSSDDEDDGDIREMISARQSSSETLLVLPDGTRQIGKIVIHDTVLGHGSHGTIIYKGEYEKRNVAVKRMLREYYDIAHHEVNLLRKSDHHPNVVRYFCMEEDSQFLYISLELCLATFVQVVEGPSISTRGTHHGQLADPQVLAGLDRRQLARDFLMGLAHLHSLNIVHRDVKPHNVLLSYQLRGMISDFGLCTTLHDNESSFQTTGAGTTGWVAPEILKDERMTRSVDVFSAGCVVHYLLHGLHPFGAYFEREVNVRKGKRKLTKGAPLTNDVILRMIAQSPSKRLTADQALAHPYFWSPAKALNFLMDVSDRIERESAESHLLKQLEKNEQNIVGTDWRSELTEELLIDMEKYRKYKWGSLADLLRAIRNKKHHYQELPTSVKTSLGDLPNGFMEYWSVRFPRLLLHVYNMVSQSELRREQQFSDYFTQL